ncbi:uncharacterized protein LOC134816235 isoform X2 [Bolinopsis microptera]|uniref:uncharacterized protein LOC134816235 isoform X2 n=1 Tax=Bolinopsis microptera TaxID=2820187 RepID=UPI00307A3C99
MDSFRNFVLTKSAQIKAGKSDLSREPVVRSSFKDLPISEVSYPNNDIKVQNIAPLDNDMRERISTYFPKGLQKKEVVVGPNGRPRSLSLQPDMPGDLPWNMSSGEVAYGMSISLYEEDSEKGVFVGDPIADCCAVICTCNYIIMVCADGCGWGDGARTAARIAVLSMLRTLTKKVLYNDIYSSTDIFEFLSEGMNQAQKDLIASEGCGMTTLCATVIAPLKYHNSPDGRWVVCNVRVGDTATYRYCKPSEKLALISHRFKNEDRNMGDCGGCLGPVVGHQPDLTNLQYSISLADNHCTIFLATDGVGDNFNPHVTNQIGPTNKCSDFESEPLLHKVYCSCLNDDSSGNSCDLRDLPIHKQLEISEKDKSTHKHYCKCLKKVDDLCPTFVDILSLKYFNQTINSYYEDVSVKDFVISICRMLTESTDRKRTAMKRFKERLTALSSEETDMVNRCHRRYVKTIPGKLDHASLVAVNLGKMRTLNSYYLLSADSRTTSILLLLKERVYKKS